MKISNFKFQILFLFSIYYFLFTIVPAAHTQTMENGLYKIQMGNLNSIAGESSDTNYNLSITSGETAPGLFEGPNYKVKSGFQYVRPGSAFSFAVSNSLIDFGTLSPTNPVLRTSTLTINNTSAEGYKVTAAENHQLQVPSTGAIIPDTTCDDGKCNEKIASIWDSTLTYGFGYRCDSLSVISNGVKITSCVSADSSFTDSKYFKHFSDTSKKESASTIMKGNKGRSQKATVTYKVNISSSQPAGLYTNSVTYLATPNF